MRAMMAYDDDNSVRHGRMNDARRVRMLPVCVCVSGVERVRKVEISCCDGVGRKFGETAHGVTACYRIR